MVLESGARTNVISEKLVKNLDIKTKKTKIVVGLAYGWTRPSLGLTVTTEVIVHNVRTELEMLVLPDGDEPILLGGDWHVKTGASTNILGGKEVSLRKEELSLKRETQS